MTHTMLKSGVVDGATAFSCRHCDRVVHIAGTRFDIIQAGEPLEAHVAIDGLNVVFVDVPAGKLQADGAALVFAEDGRR